MGILDNLKNRLSGKKDTIISSETKAPSQILKENGIDTRGLKFAFGSDGTVTVSGTVQKESDKARIKQLLLEIPGIKQVKQELSLAVAEAPAQPAAVPAQTASANEAGKDNAAPAQGTADSAAATTYTVQAGDTLWKISRQYYGDGSKYLRIFEANKGLLKDPDHIFPGQELVIPDAADQGSSA